MTTLSRFEIHQPGSVREASQMLAHYGEDAGIYAGGTELLLAMRHEALNYRHLIDLKVIPGLDAIEVRDGTLEIGAACDASQHRALGAGAREAAGAGGTGVARGECARARDGNAGRQSVFCRAAFRSGDAAAGARRHR